MEAGKRRGRGHGQYLASRGNTGKVVDSDWMNG